MSTCPPFTQTPTYAKASSFPRAANFLKSLGGALLNIKSYIKEFWKKRNKHLSPLSRLYWVLSTGIYLRADSSQNQRALEVLEDLI